VPLRNLLIPHQVETAFERGWSTLNNGDLLAVAEKEGFEVLVTTDRNLRNQQNLSRLRIAIVYSAIVKVICDTSLGNIFFFLSKTKRFSPSTETSPESILPSRVWISAS